MKPLIVDTFPFNNEIDILQMRCEELLDSKAVDYMVLVEATRDHQDHVKPLWFADNLSRFAEWNDRIVHVIVADGEMPSLAQDADPWAREHAQREFIARGLNHLNVDNDAIILQSDVDEIPSALHARNVRPTGMVSFEQRLHCFAVDWLHPMPWYGTVACTVNHLAKLGNRPFAFMRDTRLTCENPPHLRDAGWHFSWLGGRDAALAKLGSFCHPEIRERTETMLSEDTFLKLGYHVDGTKQRAVEVDDSWPAFIAERRCPPVWFRPR